IYLLNNNKREDKQFIKKLKSLYFMPINGVEFDKEDIKDKFKVNQKILKTKSFLFIVDNDNAGLKFKRIINNDTIVKTIGEIMNDKKDIKTIENFIDDEDIKNFKLVDSNDKKHIINSYEFKRALIDNKVSKTTINNLILFIKKIIEEIR
ncbi:hypothetical protein IKS57_01035, partial [bacterium]|nr:hypothetical protein [bacterium]